MSNSRRTHGQSPKSARPPRPAPIIRRTVIALLGGGEQARVIAEAAMLGGLSVRGVIADHADDGVIHLGNEKTLEGDPLLRKANKWIVAIGNMAARQRVAKHWQDRLEWISVVHPQAWVSPSARIGAGVFVGPGAIIHNHAQIGDHAIINSGAIIEHDVQIGTAAHIAPGAVLGGGARIGAGTMVGLGARVRDHHTIGDNCIVGMGAVVVNNVAAGVTVFGNPAREQRS